MSEFGVVIVLTLDDPEIDRLAREISALTGETIRKALAERLYRERRPATDDRAAGQTQILRTDERPNRALFRRMVQGL